MLEVEEQPFASYVVKGSSRLREEFEVLVWLGRGGFGDVLKVNCTMVLLPDPSMI
jgi:hypothetical protein